MAATQQQHSESILAEVARHERELLQQLERAKEDARKTVEKARADAIKVQQDEEARTQSEIAAMRREAEHSRRTAFEHAVAEKEASLSAQREAVLARVPEVAKSVLGYFMPGGGQG